jgi:hypothetical protein
MNNQNSNSKTMFVSIAGAILYIVIILIFGYFNQKNLLPAIFGLIGLLLLLFKPEKLLELFIIILLSNGIITREDYISQVIGIQQVLVVLTLIYLITQRVAIINSPPLISNTIYLTIYVLLYISYTTFKNSYFGIFDATIESSLFKITNLLLLSIVLILILRNHTEYNHIVANGLIAAAVFLSLTAIFSGTFQSLGFYTEISEDGYISRVNGFIGNGDANTLALVLILSIALLLNLPQWRNNTISKLLLLPLFLFTIGITGSRSGLILLIIIFILTVLKKNTRKNYFLVLGLTITVILSTFFFQATLDRFSNVQEEQFSTAPGTSNRIGKWIFYYNHIINEQYSLLRGSSKEISLGWKGEFLVAHNFYIQCVYNAGMLFLVGFLFILIKYFYIRGTSRSNILILIIPTAIGIFYISDIGIINFFILAVAASTKN